MSSRLYTFVKNDETNTVLTDEAALLELTLESYVDQYGDTYSMYRDGKPTFWWYGFNGSNPEKPWWFPLDRDELSYANEEDVRRALALAFERANGSEAAAS